MTLQPWKTLSRINDRYTGTGNADVVRYDAFHREQAAEYYEQLRQGRAYEAGDSNQVLSTDVLVLVETNNRTFHYKFNVCPTVIEARCDRLEMTGLKFAVPGDESGDMGASIARAIDKIRRLNRADETDYETYYNAARDGVSYWVLDFDADTNRPVFALHEQYDGYDGIECVHANDKLERAMKFWSEIADQSTGTRRERLNIYVDNAIYMLHRTVAKTGENRAVVAWVPYIDAPHDIVRQETIGGQPYKVAIRWFTHDRTESGTPLGIPVIPYKHGNGDWGRSVLENLVPDMQDTLNASLADKRIAEMLGAVAPVYVGGWAPTEDDAQKVLAGQTKYMEGSEEGYSFFQPQPENIQQFIESVNANLRLIATDTKTPLPMLNPSGHVMAEGTLQQQEAGLLAVVKRLQIQFGNAHEDAARMMCRLDIVFNDVSEIQTALVGNSDPASVGQALQILQDVDISAEWKDAQTRNEAQDIQNAQALRQMGVPLTLLAKRIDLTPEQLEQVPLADSAFNIEQLLTTLGLLGDNPGYLKRYMVLRAMGLSDDEIAFLQAQQDTTDAAILSAALAELEDGVSNGQISITSSNGTSGEPTAIGRPQTALVEGTEGGATDDG